MAALTEVPDAELEAYRQAIVAEQDRRRTLAQAGKQMDDIARAVLAATGQEDGGEWVQPTDATNAYPKGWTVTFEGKTYVSLTPANVWSPNVSGWREVVEDGGAPEYVAPTGAHDAYNTGDHVMFEGTEYVALQDGLVWSPAEFPEGWEKI